MADVTRLSASKLDALYAERSAEMMAISDELIVAGLGTASGEEIRKLADNGDPLAARYAQVQDAFQEVAYGRAARRHNPGAMKPARSKAAASYSAVRQSREEEMTPTAGHANLPAQFEPAQVERIQVERIQVERADRLRAPALIAAAAGTTLPSRNRK